MAGDNREDACLPGTGTSGSIACQTMSFISGSNARMMVGTSTRSLVV